MKKQNELYQQKVFNVPQSGTLVNPRLLQKENVWRFRFVLKTSPITAVFRRKNPPAAT